VSFSFWGGGIRHLHDLHQEDDKVQECNHLRYNFSDNFYDHEWDLDECGPVAKDTDFFLDFGHGLQLGTNGTSKL
jgi:hypothetical protein